MLVIIFTLSTNRLYALVLIELWNLRLFNDQIVIF